MSANLRLALVLGVSLCAAAAVRAGVITTYTYTTDADLTPSLRTQYTYTQVIDLGQSMTPAINGVTFVQDSAGNRLTYQYDVTGATVRQASASDNVSGSVKTLESHYIYDSTGRTTTTVTIGGLTPGYTYETDFYDIGSGSAGGQYNSITDGDLTRYVYDENYNGAGNGNVLRDVYTPLTTTYTYTFTVDNNKNDFNPGDPNSGNNTTVYLYGFSNRLVSTPEPSSLALLGVGAGSLLAYACKRRRRAA